MLLAALLATSCGLLKAYLWGIPPPIAQDEFGYLTIADTFVSGRITNPTPPMWRHFKSLFVLQQPTYTGKFPPGQAVVLAFGQFFFGVPMVGVWLSTGLACAFVCWALWQWVDAPWAIVGTALATTHLVINYWNFSYWGGSLAMLGGALVFGGVRRALLAFRVRDGLAIGIGFAILVFTRPVEGAITGIASIIALAVYIWYQRPQFSAERIRNLLVPVTCCCSLAILAFGFYNWKTTGNPLVFAQQLEAKEAYPIPFFVFGHLGPPPVSKGPLIVEQYLKDILEWQAQQSFSGFVDAALYKIGTFWHFYFGWELLIPLLALPLLRRDRWMLIAASVCLMTGTVMLFETWFHPHYAAPFAVLVYVLIAQSLAVVWRLRWNKLPWGRWAVLLTVALNAALVARTILVQPEYIRKKQLWGLERQQIVDRFDKDPQKQLLLVRYAPDHIVYHEWVYNRADLDAAKIVWAHEMPGNDAELLNYYPTRQVWLVEADAVPAHLLLLRPALKTQAR